MTRVLRIGVVGAIVAALALGVAAAPAAASPSARFGVQDDAWLLYAGGALPQRLDTLDRLGVRLVRFTLRWDEVAPTKPRNQLDPNDPAYRWGPFDGVIRGLHAHGIATLLTVWGAPRWANGGHAANWLPTAGLGNFAYAASKRYPWVHLWTVWNEPNTRVAAVPVSPKLYVTRLLNPTYALLHRASRANVVAGGVTSPRSTASSMSPYAFMVGMHAARAHLDAYAQNPYPSSRFDTPFKEAGRATGTFTMAHLSTIRADVTRFFGSRTPLWLTEYGYQTNPPDRILGVSPALQATYENEAAMKVWAQPGVTMLIHFIVRDDPELGGWQSGFLNAGGAAKPSFAAFAVPFAQQSRSGTRVVLWGQVRPGTGARPYVIQRWTGRGWTNVGGVRQTGVGGTLRVTIAATRGTSLRLKPLQLTLTSRVLTVV